MPRKRSSISSDISSRKSDSKVTRYEIASVLSDPTTDVEDIDDNSSSKSSVPRKRQKQKTGMQSFLLKIDSCLESSPYKEDLSYPILKQTTLKEMRREVDKRILIVKKKSQKIFIVPLSSPSICEIDRNTSPISNDDRGVSLVHERLPCNPSASKAKRSLFDRLGQSRLPPVSARMERLLANKLEFIDLPTYCRIIILL